MTTIQLHRYCKQTVLVCLVDNCTNTTTLVSILRWPLLSGLSVGAETTTDFSSSAPSSMHVIQEEEGLQGQKLYREILCFPQYFQTFYSKPAGEKKRGTSKKCSKSLYNVQPLLLCVIIIRHCDKSVY